MKLQLPGSLSCLLCMMIFFTACKKEEINQVTCTESATFYSTATCFGEVAIDLDGKLLSVDNFSDFTTIEDFVAGDSIRINYTIIQKAPDGLLCGVLVVADLVELSCFEKLD